MLDRYLPATGAVVFGDIWGVDGGYSVECAERGRDRVLLIDSLRLRPGGRGSDIPRRFLVKATFKPAVMRIFQERLTVGVAFDILLHQPAMLGTLTLLLAKVEEKFCVVQPMLEEQQASGSLVYLPGNPAVEDLYPMQTQAPTSEVRVFDAQEVDDSHWIWGMTPSFLSSAMSGEGFSLTRQRRFWDRSPTRDGNGWARSTSEPAPPSEPLEHSRHHPRPLRRWLVNIGTWPAERSQGRSLGTRPRSTGWPGRQTGDTGRILSGTA